MFYSDLIGAGELKELGRDRESRGAPTLGAEGL